MISTEKNNKMGVPDKYFVITNNEIIRVRYVIVYGKENRNIKQQTVCDSKVIKWISNHKSITAMIVYAFILFIIGASNSQHGYHLKQFIRQLTFNVIESINMFCSKYFQKLFG